MKILSIALAVLLAAAFLSPETAPSQVLTNVNGASYERGNLAPESVVTLFGSELTEGRHLAGLRPLPLMLGNIRIVVTDARGEARPAGLFAVFPNQINYLMPPGTALGRAEVAIYRQQQLIASEFVTVSKAAPGLFSANGDGRGPALALALRITPEGLREWLPLYDAAVPTGSRSVVPVIVDSEDDAVYFVLLATGVRGAGGDVSAELDGEPAPLLGVAPSPEFEGVDQIALGPFHYTPEAQGIEAQGIEAQGTLAQVIQVKESGNDRRVRLGPSTVSVSVTAGGIPSNELMLPGLTVRGNSLPACTLQIGPDRVFSRDGGDGVLEITTQEHCAWQVAADKSWLRLLAGNSGQGPGRVSYAVTPNSDCVPRDARLTVTVLGLEPRVAVHNVGQQPSRTEVSIQPTRKNFGHEGGLGSVIVTSPDGCEWTVTPPPEDWVSVDSKLTFKGRATVNYRVAKNPTSQARTAQMGIGDKRHLIEQEGLAECADSLAIRPESIEHAHNDRTGTFAITAPTDCRWRVASGVNWMTIRSGSSGQGNGTVLYALAENESSKLRPGSMAVSDQTSGASLAAYRVQQLGAPCSFGVTQPPATVEAAGGVHRTRLTPKPDDCEWSAASGAGWARLTAPTPGQVVQGARDIVFQVDPNPAMGVRSWETAITGRPSGRFAFTIGQKGVPFGSIYLEGEAGSGSGSNMFRSMARGGRTRLLKSGGSISFTITNLYLAAYEFHVIYSNDQPVGAKETITVSTTGGAVGSSGTEDTRGRLCPGCGWNVFQTTGAIGSRVLNPGQHTVVLSIAGGDSYGIEIDHIQMVRRHVSN